MSSAGIHVLPSRASISVGDRSVGCTCRSASTFALNCSSTRAAASAAASFARTLPDKYSSSVSQRRVWGLRKMRPFRSGTTSLGLRWSRPARKSRSTQPRSLSVTSSASLAVPTWGVGRCFWMVRSRKMAALVARPVSSSYCSSDSSKGRSGSPRNAEVLARVEMGPHRATKPS